MKNFALIGAGGYIAPRHMQAIKDTGNNLIAAYDVNDSVGAIDSRFPDVPFFTTFEEFVDYLHDKQVDFVSIATPNYMHKYHIKYALRKGANVICEKPLVLDPADIDEIAQVEKETGKKVFTVLQLRTHQAIIALRDKIKAAPAKMYDISLSYFTSRGPWYHKSWKADVRKSGGLANNIGIHFYDMLVWIFGDVTKNELIANEPDYMSGKLELENAKIDWVLSVDRHRLPQQAKDAGKSTFRSIKIDGEEFEFSEGFTDLHTIVYKEIMAGRGFGLDDARVGIKIVSDLRKS